MQQQQKPGLHVHHRKAFQPAAHQWEDSGEQTETIWLETSLKRNVLLQGAQGFDCTTAVRTWVQSREDLDSCSCRHPRQLWVTHSITCVKAINVFVVWEWQPDKLARCARIYILSFLIYLMTFWFKLKWLKPTGVLRFAKCYCHCYYANNANANMLVLSKTFFCLLSIKKAPNSKDQRMSQCYVYT